MSGASHDGNKQGDHTPPFHGHPDPEVIAIWVDEPESLAPERRQQLNAHIATCQECQQVATDFRAIVTALSRLGDITPPRSFTLTDAAAQQRHPTPVLLTETRAWRSRQMQATRLASAVAAMLLVLVLSIDLITSGNSTNPGASQATSSQMSIVAPNAASDQAVTSDDSGGGAAGGAESEAKKRDSGESAASAAEEAAPAAPTESEAFAKSATPAAANMDSAVPAPEHGATAAEGDVAGTPAPEFAASTLPTTAPAVQPDAATDRLHLAETALAALLVWLLIAMLALPALSRSTGNQR